MTCPKCADVRTVKVSPQAKGSEIMMGVKQVSYRHTCIGCDTKLNLVGEGKAKHQVATHNCTAKSANNRFMMLSPCSGRHGDGPMTSTSSIVPSSSSRLQ